MHPPLFSPSEVGVAMIPWRFKSAKKLQSSGIGQQTSIQGQDFRYCKALISRAIYFRDICEADIIAKIIHCENLILPL